MNKIEILMYEIPWYAEYVSWGWLQNIISKRVADKVNRKYARYERRKIRERIFNQTSSNN